MTIHYKNACTKIVEIYSGAGRPVYIERARLLAPDSMPQETKQEPRTKRHNKTRRPRRANAPNRILDGRLRGGL